MEARIVLEPVTFARVDQVKRAVGQPVLEGDDRLWILGGPLVVSLTPGGPVTVPKGFVTDGASIPGFAQALTGWHPWDEPQRWGAIVHDWLYCCAGVDKAFADEAFRALLRSAGADAFRTEVMYLAVRLFGGHAYAQDQQYGPDIWADPTSARRGAAAHRHH